MLDGELAVLLALLEVIDVEPRTPVTLQNGANAGASSVVARSGARAGGYVRSISRQLEE